MLDDTLGLTLWDVNVGFALHVHAMPIDIYVILQCQNLLDNNGITRLTTGSEIAIYHIILPCLGCLAEANASSFIPVIVANINSNSTQ